MTVQELIDLLNEVENKDKDVFVYNEYDGMIYPIDIVDLDIEDRIDLQIFIKGN